MGQAIWLKWEVVLSGPLDRLEECMAESLRPRWHLGQAIKSTMVQTEGRIKGSAASSTPVWQPEPQLSGYLSGHPLFLGDAPLS